ncbi:MAG: nucleotide sugar dehydrogenase [Candidatus Marsarchaeota archaeon]|nr:nucleotide sugar dehydrogenase [Candidatus Marsarchaeota archaeon]
MAAYKYDVCVVGGLGHVGLPLSMMLADKGLRVCAFDISKEAYETTSKGRLHFMEENGEPILKRVLANGMLTLSLSKDSILESEAVIITIGTPIDLHLSPEVAVEDFISKNLDYIKDGQLLVLRSTVYPGTTEKVHNLLVSSGKKVDLAFCPERIAQGYAVRELVELPQIVSSTTEHGIERASKLFGVLTDDIITLPPKEAELAKLFTNAWRYIKFAAANQFYIIANETNADFYRIYKAMSYKYPRVADLPSAGFASGPCLFKDTVQLNAFANSNFHIGNSAIQINEGLPAYMVSKLKQKYDLRTKSVGILGLAFKAENDDKRDSLSYKLMKSLKFDVKNLYYTDPYAKEPGSIDAEELVRKSDIIILATPHKRYAKLNIGKDKVLVDIWGFYSKAQKGT